jgi:hypothetical protein
MTLKEDNNEYNYARECQSVQKLQYLKDRSLEISGKS